MRKEIDYNQTRIDSTEYSHIKTSLYAYFGRRAIVKHFHFWLYVIIYYRGSIIYRAYILIQFIKEIREGEKGKVRRRVWERGGWREVRGEIEGEVKD